MTTQKSKQRMRRFLDGKLPENYHLTFSRSEDTDTNQIREFCDRGGNVAVVFRDHLPEHWRGVKVINGDTTDLRFQDEQGVIVFEFSVKKTPHSVCFLCSHRTDGT